MCPETEFRIMGVNSPEPIDRTAEGTPSGDGGIFDFGAIDTTDEAQDIPVKVLWWRVVNMNGAREIKNIRVWISGTEELSGTNSWYMDITDVWTPGKTPVQVRTGTPGSTPLAVPTPNITKVGGGSITGVTNDNTTQYIYVTGNFGVNEATGTKSGVRLNIKYDYI